MPRITGGTESAFPSPDAPGSNEGGYNILFILTDQEHYMGPGWPIPLPGHERLRRTGTYFENHHIAADMCSASRAVIYTGVHMPLNGIFDNAGVPYMKSLEPKVPTIGPLGATIASDSYFEPELERAVCRQVVASPSNHREGCRHVGRREYRFDSQFPRKLPLGLPACSQASQLWSRLMNAREIQAEGDVNHERISVPGVRALSQQHPTSFNHDESAWRTENTGPRSESWTAHQ